MKEERIRERNGGSHCPIVVEGGRVGRSQFQRKGHGPGLFSTHMQRHNTKHLKQIFPEKELCCHSPNSYIHVSVSDLYMYIPIIGLPILLQENTVGGPIVGMDRSLTDT
jgi:hypothetical protein